MPFICDLSGRARFALTGSDRVRFLHSMTTNDIEALRPGAGCHAAMLTTKGRLLGDLVVYCDEERLLLELDGELREKIKTVLDRHIVMDDVELADLTDELPQLGVYGPDAAAALAAALGSTPPAALAPYHHVMLGGIRVAAAPELGMAGFHLFGRPKVAGETLDEAAFEVRRIEAGTPRYGIDMDEERLVLEAGIDDAVNLTKGCYLGQEVVARATARGHINRKLMGLLIDGERPPAAGARLSAPERPEAGHVTSATFSPRLGRAIALGYVHRTVWKEGTRLALHDGEWEGVAEVTSRPLVRPVRRTL